MINFINSYFNIIKLLLLIKIYFDYGNFTNIILIVLQGINIKKKYSLYNTL